MSDTWIYSIWPAKETNTLYINAWMARQDGNFGSHHILQSGMKVALCGAKSRNWHYAAADDRPLEKIYRTLERRLKDTVRHRPNRALTPCRRCMVAAQKLRDPLDRMADIPLE